MPYAENVNVSRKWEECDRDPELSPRWQALYVSLKPDGELWLSKKTHEALGSPPGYVLLFDRERQVVGMRPSDPQHKTTAYPAQPRGRHGAVRVRANRLVRDFGIYSPETVRFPRAQIDRQGVLILDLKDTVRSAKKRGRK